MATPLVGWFREVECLRSSYTETKSPNKVKDTYQALLAYVDNILQNTNHQKQ